MVRITGRRTTITRLLLAMICVLFHTQSIASPKLVLTTDKTQVELGHPIRVQLYGISLNTPLSGINLENLAPDFGVITDYASGAMTDQRWPGQSVQMLQFKLYPRKAGNLTIPSLHIGNLHSKEKRITIVTGETGSPTLQFDTLNPYQRQEVIVHFILSTGFSNARLTTKPGENLKGLEIVPLEFSRTSEKDGKYRLHIGWAITAYTEGKHDLQLPPVEYTISGGSRKLFYPPFRRINVKPLPSYLPPTIPVGKISITSQLSAAGWLHANELSYWTLRLTAKATDVYSLPPVLRQVKTTTEVQFFPVTSQRKIQVIKNGVISQVTHNIPFKSLKSGRITLPEIQFQYFDPELGKIKLLHFSTKPLFVLSIFWQVFLALLTIVIFIWLIKVTYKKWQHWQKSNRKRERAIQLLQKPGSKNNIRNAIRLFCEADTGDTNTTLSEWKQYWPGRYQTNDHFENFYRKISNACYSYQDNIDVTVLTSELLFLFQNRKRIKIFSF